LGPPSEGGVDLSKWQEVIAGLELGGAARQLAANCAYAGREGGLIRLELDPAQSLLKTASLVDKLSQALSRALGETVRVEIELAAAVVETPARAEQRAVDAELDAARRSLDSDATVRGFKEKFGATLKTDSVKPH
jgi:DNA polymerase-3 subunit gamma/tau